MTYTVSHRQAGVARSDVAGLVRHEYRDVDRSNGVESQHSNERIVPSRTQLNESLLWVKGEPVAMTGSSQILDELDRRLATAGGTRTSKSGKVTKVAVRSDAKVVRNLVLQLDPEFTRSAEYLTSSECPEDHREAVKSHLYAMVDHYRDVYGADNLLASTLHLDETSPHIHLMVTPIDEKGRVRQESFIASGRGPKSGLALNDRAMRTRLADRGYDVDPSPIGNAREHLPVDQFAQWRDEQQELADREVLVEDRERRVSRREAQVEVELKSSQELAAAAQESTARARAAQQAAELARQAYEAANAAAVASESASSRMLEVLEDVHLRQEERRRVADVQAAAEAAEESRKQAVQRVRTSGPGSTSTHRTSCSGVRLSEPWRKTSGPDDGLQR